MNIAKNKNIFINLENIKLLIFYSFSFLLIPSFTFAAGSGMHSPIEQFVVKTLVDIKDPIFGYDISFTNASLFMILASIVPLAILIMGVRAAEMVPGKIQSISEMMFEFVENLLIENTGDSGRPYFSFIFTLFLLVLFGNLLGMLPYSYTFTSQIIITFFMAIIIFIAVTLIGIYRHGFGFLSLFLPSGTPLVLQPLLFVIELISYCIRPISLSVRLFANMLAGHTLLKVFGGLAVMLISSGSIFLIPVAVLPIAAIIGMTALEVLVAVLQAYVFTVLTCIYLNDALNLHH
jgi:F-type H+-transporting ATPase subunit a